MYRGRFLHANVPPLSSFAVPMATVAPNTRSWPKVAGLTTPSPFRFALELDRKMPSLSLSTTPSTFITTEYGTKVPEARRHPSASPPSTPPQSAEGYRRWANLPLTWSRYTRTMPKSTEQTPSARSPTSNDFIGRLSSAITSPIAKPDAACYSNGIKYHRGRSLGHRYRLTKV